MEVSTTPKTRKTNFYRGINYPHGPMSAIGLPLNELNAYNVNVTLLKDCDDDVIPPELQKKKYSFGTRNGRTYDSGSFDGVKGEIAMPFNIFVCFIQYRWIQRRCTSQLFSRTHNLLTFILMRMATEMKLQCRVRLPRNMLEVISTDMSESTTLMPTA